jgi:hypothetical protein
MSSLAQSKQDSSYWQSDPDFVFFKILHSPRFLDAEMRPAGTSHPVSLAPLRRDLIGIAAFGLGMGIEAYFPLPIRTADEKELGQNARFMDLQGAAFLKNLSLAYSYQQYDGWINRSAAIPELGGYYREIRINPIYTLNWRKFSWKMPINQTSQQLKSAGSPILAAEFRDIRNELYGLVASNQDIVTQNLRGAWLQPGYAYTWAKEGWYLSAALLGSVGVFREKDTDSQSKFAHNGLGYRYRLAGGYNDGRILAGILFEFQHNEYPSNHVDFLLQQRLLKFSLGYRFEAGQGMKKLRQAIPVLRSF